MAEITGLLADATNSFGEFSWGYLEGQGDLVSGLITGVSRVTIWVRGLLTYFLRPPDPPSNEAESSGTHRRL